MGRRRTRAGRGDELVEGEIDAGGVGQQRLDVLAEDRAGVEEGLDGGVGQELLMCAGHGGRDDGQAGGGRVDDADVLEVAPGLELEADFVLAGRQRRDGRAALAVQVGVLRMRGRVDVGAGR